MVQSRYMRRILHAQEEGARRFMGTYFGDCMYGPFPRAWWHVFERVGVLYKVDWDQVDFDTHSALLMNILSDQEESRRHSASVVTLAEDRARAARARAGVAPSGEEAPLGRRPASGSAWEPLSPALRA